MPPGMSFMRTNHCLLEIRLDGRLGAVGVADLDFAILDRFQEALGLEVLDHALAGFKAVLPGVRPG